MLIKRQRGIAGNHRPRSRQTTGRVGDLGPPRVLEHDHTVSVEEAARGVEEIVETGAGRRRIRRIEEHEIERFNSRLGARSEEHTSELQSQR